MPDRMGAVIQVLPDHLPSVSGMEAWIPTKFTLVSGSFQRLNVHLAISSSLIAVHFTDVKDV